jgi:hypothetical protein
MSDIVVNNSRDEKGRFVVGNKPPGGRPKGARDRHSRNFLESFANDFEQHGAAVIAQVRAEKPDVYLRVAADLLPRQAELDISVDIRSEITAILADFRAMNGGKPDRGLETILRRFFPKVIDAEPD